MRLSAILALALPLAARAQAPTRATVVQTIDSIAGASVKSGRVAAMAIAVVKGRDTLLWKGYGFADVENQVAATPQTVFRIGSLTKQFTSAAVMQLVEQGKVSLDDDIRKYLPQVPTRGRKITIRQLLNHTSGIPSYTDVQSFGPVSRLDLPQDSLLAIVAKDSLQFEPGSHFYYNNTGYFVLGMLIEKLTGKPYGEYVNERLFKTNGLAATTYCDSKRIIPRRAHGYTGGQAGLSNAPFLSMDLPYAAGSLCSTVGDLVEWSKRLHAGAVVSPASLRAMTTPVKLTSNRPMPYGFGLMPDTVGTHRVIQHGGGINGFVSYLMHFPDDSLTIAVLANTSPAPSEPVAQAVARVVLGVPRVPATPPKNIALAAAEMARYIGKYEVTFPDGSKHPLEIAEDAGGLVTVLDGQRLTMLNQGDNVFQVTGVGRAVFDVANGRATSFVLGAGGVRPLEGVRKP